MSFSHAACCDFGLPHWLRFRSAGFDTSAGMGRLTFESILNRDYPVVMGTLTLSALLTLLGLLLTDILYAVVDPRIRYD